MSQEQTDDPVRAQGDRTDGWWVMTFVIGMAALIVSIVAVIGAFGNESGAAAPAGSTGETEFDITLGEMFVSPSSIEVPAGQRITFTVTNTGTMAHDLKVLGSVGTDLLKPGESATVTVGPFGQDTQAWCTVPGHKEAGMVLNITVLGGTSSDDTGSHDAATDPGAAVSDAAKIDPQAAPADDWDPRDPRLEPPASGTVHEIALEATEEIIEVAPGVTQQMWTFGGQVPGPTLHGKIGDTFRITLTNSGTLGHSIDFHASKVAWNDEMRTIQPGEELKYDYSIGRDHDDPHNVDEIYACRCGAEQCRGTMLWPAKRPKPRAKSVKRAKRRRA